MPWNRALPQRLMGHPRVIVMTDELKNLLTMVRSGPNVEPEARRILLAYRAKILAGNRAAEKRGRARPQSVSPGKLKTATPLVSIGGR